MKPLLNSKDVCAVLGVSPAVLSRWVHSNKIPFVLLTSGKKKLIVRFRENELEAWLDRRSRGAVPKIRSSLSEVDKKPGKAAQHIEIKDNGLFLETSASAKKRLHLRAKPPLKT